jgi:hypothetical protein
MDPQAGHASARASAGELKKKSCLSLLALAAAFAITPAQMHADQVFNWTYGGGTDPVYASGTLDAVPDASISGAFDILSGSGTRADSTGTYAVTIVPFSGSNDPSACSYSPDKNVMLSPQAG